MRRLNVVITVGDPSGCGPLVTLSALCRGGFNVGKIFVVGSEAVLRKYPAYKIIKDKVTIVDLPFDGIDKLPPRPSWLGGKAALAYLDCAVDLMEKTGITRLVTAPVSKEAVQMVLPAFYGHTEYLAAHYGTKQVEMMMVASKIKTVLFTRHLPFAGVSKAIKAPGLRRTIDLVLTTLKRSFKIAVPKIALLSVNPHAGVHTFLGPEEKVILEAARSFKKNVDGPLASDTAFIPANLKKYDCFICMYHDQGMVPFKLLAFKDGVNFTAGLPIVRTSPAHGTAFDLMRNKIMPDCTSMHAAIKLALSVCA